MSAISVLQKQAKNLETQIHNTQVTMDDSHRRFLNAHMLQVTYQNDLNELRRVIAKLEAEDNA